MSGVALDPEPGALFSVARIGGGLVADHRMDIRDASALGAAVLDMEPEIFFHLAAQPLVRESYRNPQDTMSTNVTGTMDVLESSRRTS